MKKVDFAKNITENDIRKENFIYSFLSSIRQKMQHKRNNISELLQLGAIEQLY